MTFFYTHGSVPCSDFIIRDASCSRWELIRNPQPDAAQGMRDLGTSIPKWGVSIKPLPTQVSENPVGEEAERL